jgi:3-oxoacyl-[acyl-carrier protein] reductase
MDLKLRGKIVLVTGSSRGIGLATAKAFAVEGCRIMLSARSTEQLRGTETALRATGAEVELTLPMFAMPMTPPA